MPAPTIQLARGDALSVLRLLPDDYADAVVTDPPYGLSSEPDMAEVLRHWLAGDDYVHKGSGFMGKSWDSFVPGPSVWREVYRVLKPGGHLLCFAGSRTVDLMGIAIRLAGFEIRDQLQWLYGSGFPKSMDVSKAIDKAAGAERQVVGQAKGAGSQLTSALGKFAPTYDVTASATDEAARWEGWGTALKPAHEPIVMARKPFKGTVAANVLANGTGALNIDATRIGSDPGYSYPNGAGGNTFGVGEEPDGTRTEPVASNAGGRWPANVILTHHDACTEVGTKVVGKGQTGMAAYSQPDIRGGNFNAEGDTGRQERQGMVYGAETVEAWECHPDCPVAVLDAQSGTLKSGKDNVRKTAGADQQGNTSTAYGAESRPAGSVMVSYGDTGGASRFFYCAKAAKSERNAGVAEDQNGRRNTHPTVKPVALMRYLVKMVTPPGGTVIDPYVGSGTTALAAYLESCAAIGIDRDDDGTHLAIAAQRLIGSGATPTIAATGLIELLAWLSWGA